MEGTSLGGRKGVPEKGCCAAAGNTVAQRPAANTSWAPLPIPPPESNQPALPIAQEAKRLTHLTAIAANSSQGKPRPLPSGRASGARENPNQMARLGLAADIAPALEKGRLTHA
jgi:hypothetical protein